MFLWEYIKNRDLPVLIYGMGNGADKVFELCEKHGIVVNGIFVSDDHACDKIIHGLRVISFSEMRKTYHAAIILVAFGIYQEIVIQRVRKLAENYEVYAPDLPLSGGPEITPNWLSEHSDEIALVNSIMSDEQSRHCLQNCLAHKLSGSIELLDEIHTERNTDMMLLNLSDHETYLDLGAYNGDTIREFLNLTDGQYTSITAFEPNRHNFKKLQANIADIDHVTLYPYAAWDCECSLTFTGKSGRMVSVLPSLPGQYRHIHSVDAIAVDSLDTIFSYIKFDVEGSEYAAIMGMKNLIANYKPKLMVSVYHKTDDLINIPILIHTLNPNYQFYLRKNPCLPAWELQLYCV